MIGYCRLMGDEGRDAIHRQRFSIRAEARRRGWSLTWIFDTSDDGDALDRHGMQRALKLAATDATSGIVVTSLLRLSGSLNEVAVAMEESLRNRWSVVSIEEGLNTETDAGAFLAQILASYATKADPSNPIEGDTRPDGEIIESQMNRTEVIQRIIWERVQGASLGEIANSLNRDSLSHPEAGGRWQPSMVWDVLKLTQPGHTYASRSPTLLPSP